VGPRTGLDEVEMRKFLTPPGLELSSLRCPSCIQSLYRLLYPGSHKYLVITVFLNAVDVNFHDIFLYLFTRGTFLHLRMKYRKL
jgi:hypothetical protein